MKDVLRLLRVWYSLTIPLTLIVTIYYSRGGDMDGQWPGAGLATASLSLVLMGAYAMNDYFDRSVDAVNQPDRPVAGGRVPPKVAMAVALVLTAAGLGVSLLCTFPYTPVLSGVVLGLFLYNRFSKRLGLGKQVAVGLLMITMYPLSFAQAGGVQGSRALTLFFFPLWMFLISYSFELVKDLQDVPGDRTRVSKPTPWQRYPGRWRRIANITHVYGSLVLLLPLLFGSRWLYLLLVLPAVLLSFVSTRVSLKLFMLYVFVEYIIVGVAVMADIIVLP